MKKALFYITAIILLFLISCKTKTNTDILEPQAVVQDYAELFSDSEKDSLSKKIIDYETASTNEICIYTIDSLPKDVSAQYHATTLANKLGVGKKEKDNGLLILVSKYDRAIGIATGNGTEKIITDYKCKVIIDSTMIPSFKKSDYYNGLRKGLDSIIAKWY